MNDPTPTFTTATAPWWFVAVIAGLFAFIGVIATIVGGVFSDRRKLAREDRRQWDKRIIELSVEALTLFDQWVQEQFPQPRPEMRKERLDGYYHHEMAIAQELELIASKRVDRAIVMLVAKAAVLTEHIRGAAPSGENEEADSVKLERYSAAREEFIEAIRECVRATKMD